MPEIMGHLGQTVTRDAEIDALKRTLSLALDKLRDVALKYNMPASEYLALQEEIKAEYEAASLGG